jgi:hypothetical protein
MTARARRLAVYLLGGMLAFGIASTASLLVDGVTAKRITLVVSGVAFAVAAGIVHGLRAPLDEPTPPGRPVCGWSLGLCGTCHGGPECGAPANTTSKGDRT